MRTVRRALLVLISAAALGAPGTVLAQAGTNSTPSPDASGAAVCAAAAPGHVSCFARARTAGPGGPRVHADTAVASGGYSPGDLQSAYRINSASGGHGQTVAVVDVADDPNAAADLASYRSAYGLPACGSGCFTKVNMGGAATPDVNWATEISLDLDMVSASCPNCSILLIEVPQDASGSASVSAILQGVNLAVEMGANEVSLSLGSTEFSTETLSDSQLNRPGVSITVASGDSGYGTSYPATSPNVVAVGGTRLQRAGNVRGWVESVWSGSGSGCSSFEAKPSWQHDGGCPRRTDNDVAVEADPGTGVAVYDTYGTGGPWQVLGGTSVGAPLVAGMEAAQGGAPAGTGAQGWYGSSVNDVTSGSNGSCAPAYLCTAEPGYDGPTGVGTPIGNPVQPLPPPNAGYWLVAGDGGIFSFGDAQFYGSTGGMRLNRPIVGMAALPSHTGYWLVASDGGIFSFGTAGFYGSTGDLRLNQPIVGMAVTPDGGGYWLVASDGGIFAFGDAGFHGSTGGRRLNQPIVGMAATPSGDGYWLVASDGGIFAFGDAGFYGSTGGMRLNQPIVGMAANRTGSGYWLVASDGGIFSFGSISYYGSTGGRPLNRPIVGMGRTASGNGYWLVASDGGIFSFGDGPFEGSTGGMALNQPIEGMAVS